MKKVLLLRWGKIKCGVLRWLERWQTHLLILLTAILFFKVFVNAKAFAKRGFVQSFSLSLSFLVC